MHEGYSSTKMDRFQALAIVIICIFILILVIMYFRIFPRDVLNDKIILLKRLAKCY